jgi:diguanylate cyclase (GGDEF)-like protein
MRTTIGSRWNSSLRTKLVVSLVAIQVVSLAAALLGLGEFLDNFFRKTAEAETAQLGLVVKAALRQQMLRVPNLTLDRTLADLKEAPRIQRVLIVGKDGRVAHATDQVMVGKVFDKARDTVCTVCHTGSAALTTRTYFTTAGGTVPVIRHVDLIANEKECWGCHDPGVRHNGIVLLEESTGAFHEATGTIRNRLAATGVATLALLLGMTLVVTTLLVVRPIRRLRAGVRRLGTGDLTVRVPVRGRDEVAQLAGAFNAMAGDLSRSVEEIQSKTAELTVVYSVLERVTRSIHIGELKDIVLQTHLDVLAADQAILVSRAADGTAVEVLSRRSQADRTGVTRFDLESDVRLPDGFPPELAIRWFGADLLQPCVTPDRTVAALPIQTPSRALALLLVQRGRAFSNAEANLKLLGVVADHIAVAFENARLYTLAITDGLTQLFSVRHFWDRLEHALAAGDASRFSLLMIDLDHFKSVNDRWGHPAGDRVLADIGRILLHAIRIGDSAYRYGGEEFAVLVPETHPGTGEQVAERIRAAVRNRKIALDSGETIHMTASIGVAAYPADGRSARALVAAADRALYEAKEAGRDVVRVAGPTS